MQLAERHLVKPDHPHFAIIDAAAFASKNLYNQANYQIRQAFIHEGTYLPTRKSSIASNTWTVIRHCLPRSPIPF